MLLGLALFALGSNPGSATAVPVSPGSTSQAGLAQEEGDNADDGLPGPVEEATDDDDGIPAYMLVIIGAIIVVGVVAGWVMAGRRHLS